MNYADANYDLCPHCKKRGLPRPQEGVTAVACMYCQAVIELEAPTIVEDENTVECKCKTVGRFPTPKPGAVFIEYECANCGSVYQRYIGADPIYLGARVWDRETRSWRSPEPPKTPPTVT